MLQITIPAIELWDERTQEFMSSKEQTLTLEHSLVSLSKWESKWHKAFLGKEEMSDEEVRDYVKCMTITQNVDPNIYKYLTADNYKQINEYIQAPMTATTFPDKNGKGKGRGQIVTAEVIYAWMISLQIPIEFQKWHLNRLLTQIRACSVMNETPKKMSKRDVMRQNAALNASRRQKLNSKG
jgi:hypothetical protein